jgi:hypothetical protein
LRPAYPDGGARKGIWAFATLPVPAAAVFVWRDSWWPPIVLVLWTALAAACFAAVMTRESRARSARLLEDARVSAIRTLSHHRHDWMNDLQILYGYIRLNRLDKAAQIVDRIRERMENDGRVSQIGSTELSAFLLSFRTMCDHMRLEVQVAEGFNLESASAGPDRASSCLIGLIRAAKCRAVSPSPGENVLRLSLYADADGLHADLAYEGQWTSGKDLAEEAAGLLNGWGQLTDTAGTDAAAGTYWRLKVRFPTSS